MTLVELNGYAKDGLIGLQAARIIMTEAKFALVGHTISKILGNPYYLGKRQFSKEPFLQWIAYINIGAQNNILILLQDLKVKGKPGADNGFVAE